MLGQALFKIVHYIDLNRDKYDLGNYQNQLLLAKNGPN